jgi:hypothetical protein
MQRVSAAPSGGIFISYRRQDASHLAAGWTTGSRTGSATPRSSSTWTPSSWVSLDPDPAVERTLRLGHELNGLDAVLRPVVLEGAPGDRELFDRLLARVGFADLNG